MTLLEYSKSYKDPLRQAVIEILVESSQLFQMIPFDNIPGAGLAYNVEAALPGIGFRGVNEGYTSSVGVWNPAFEPLVIAGGDMDFDKFQLATMGMGRRAQQTSAKLRALALKWLQTFIKGDAATEPRSFDGLQSRLVGSQLVPAGATSGGDALSLLVLEDAISRVDPGASGVTLMMNEKMVIRLSEAARKTTVGGTVNYTVNNFGQRVASWNGYPIVVVRKDNTNTDILGFTEANPGGGSAVGTSIYVVSLSEGHVHGIQNAPPDARELGEIHEKPVFRTRVEWFCGLAVEHPESATRIWGIKDAAVVA
jgi:hypothetical protein